MRVRCEPDEFSSGVATSGIDWVAALECELVDSLGAFEEERADGVDTRELADYIAYLSACVLRLTDGRFAESPLQSVEAVATLWKAVRI
ncbi:MAG: hypothetical protein IAI49_11185 [Candidatus Eremiobacteraeota bacterium]|nr:hypothetical protein [Candidatus Eremiobacteraeota bacterium]